MTPKEKAKELFDKTKDIVHDATDILKIQSTKRAKQCALIAVDEIINVCNNEIINCSDKTFFYWEQVKQEIEKL